MRNLSELIDKFDNEKIKGITSSEQMQIFNALKDLEMYQKVGTIAEFMTLKNPAKTDETIFPIYVCATKQSTTAKLKLEGIGSTGISVAVLYDIPIELKPFPMFTKVRIHGKELEFYLGRDNTLIQKDCKPYDFWFGKGD